MKIIPVSMVFFFSRTALRILYFHLLEANGECFSIHTENFVEFRLNDRNSTLKLNVSQTIFGIYAGDGRVYGMKRSLVHTRNIGQQHDFFFKFNVHTEFF